MRNAFKRASKLWDELDQASAEHTVLRFPKSPAPITLPAIPKAQQQYLIQKAMLDENLAKLGDTFTDTSKHDQKIEENATVAEQASSLKHENINAMFSSAFLTLGRNAFKLTY